jgi:hypothetical protein
MQAFPDRFEGLPADCRKMSKHGGEMATKAAEYKTKRSDLADAANLARK